MPLCSNNKAGSYPWFGTAGRLVFPFFACLYILLYLVFVVSWLPKATDLTIFWVAGKSVMSGHAVDLYNEVWLRVQTAKFISVPAEWQFGWFYPPAYFLVVAVLSVFPLYYPYLAVSLALMGGLFVSRARKIVFGDEWWIILSSGVVWYGLLRGQNGLLTAFLVCSALWYAQRRNDSPGGFYAGLLTIKPHLAVVIFIMFVLCRRWKALLAATLTALFINGLAIGLLGGDMVHGWLHALRYAGTLSDTNGPSLYWQNETSAYAAARLAGFDKIQGYLIHWLFFATASVMTIIVWRRTSRESLRNSSLILLTLLFSPYVMPYDLTVTVLVMVYGIREKWFSGLWGRALFFVFWQLAMLAHTISDGYQISVTPWVLMEVLVVVYRQSGATNHRKTGFWRSSSSFIAASTFSAHG